MNIKIKFFFIIIALGAIFFRLSIVTEVYAHESGAHEAVHGGSLNVIGCCEAGHAEVLATEGSVEVWFVGGGHDTNKSVRIKDEEIKLAVSIAGVKEAFDLVLKADPLKLAEESTGDCSHFSGFDKRLGEKNILFKAKAKINYKGKKVELIIDYPQGYGND